ncbi:MAG: alpha/beta fold hydrolase [Jatrophihabitans sp.]|nr:MAG: alpha/beta fold hydrolase [Jatrophihabitans sp.]
MLAFERHGTGEPLVLVHGVTHRRQAWYPVLDRLTPHREVFLVDLPGHGESPDLCTEGLALEECLRRSFRQFLDENGLQRPHVAGYSLGGRVALEAGAAGDARSVTALSPAGFWRTALEFAHTRGVFTAAARTVTRLGPRAENLARTRAGRELMYAMLMTHPLRVSQDAALGDIRAFRRAIPALYEILDAATPFTAAIPAEVPVLVAWAGRDFVLPRWQAGVARTQLPQARHEIMHGVGHVPMWDNPRLVADVLLRGSAHDASVAPLPLSAAPRRRRPLRVASA